MLRACKNGASDLRTTPEFGCLDSGTPPRSTRQTRIPQPCRVHCPWNLRREIDRLAVHRLEIDRAIEAGADTNGARRIAAPPFPQRGVVPDEHDEVTRLIVYQP